MKSIINFSCLAVALSLMAAGSASADDQRLQDHQVRQAMQPTRTTTVAVYTNHRGVSRHEARQQVQQEQQDQTRFELRSTAHGQVYGAYTAGQ